MAARPPAMTELHENEVEECSMLSPLRRHTHSRLRRLSIDQTCEPQSPPKPDVPIAEGSWLHRNLDYYEKQADQRFPMLNGHLQLLIHSLSLGVSSMRWFRLGFTAVWLGFRLIIFGIVLLPAFSTYAFSYFHDKRIQRSVQFGPNKRNYLDLYIPKEAQAAIEGKGPKVPVVVAVMGGAWIMGHRAWNTQLGLRLMDFGVLVCAVDYRNFPIGRVPDMVEDLSRAMTWIFANVEAFGGDVNNILLVGQSAGAHLSALLLLEHSLLEAKSTTVGHGEMTAHKTQPVPFKDGWRASNFKLFLGVSGPYDLVRLEPHLVSRGIYSRILYSLSMDGDLAGCSPALILNTQDWQNAGNTAAALLPPMHLFHGELDKSVPSWSSVQFAGALRKAGVSGVTLDVRPNMTHTFPVIEGPMAGQDPQVEVMLAALLGKKRSSQLLSASPGQRICSQKLLDLATFIMPY